MTTIVSLPFRNEKALPPHFQDDNRYSEEFVKYCVENYSSELELVFDPFAGYGTTLIVAERMNRNAVGIEISQKKVEFIKSELKDNTLIKCGDSTKIESYKLPKFDLMITSPPYMNNSETTSPLDGYKATTNYQSYLDNIERIFHSIEKLMKPTSYCLVEVANLKSMKDETITTLAWDIAKRIGRVMKMEKEVIIQWINQENVGAESVYGYGYDHSYLLIFRKYDL
ncbi:MAG: methyltransferase domain-containing protein [Candidatus Heimdallarchaeota archaeon]|nr:methyltransferase domain-containing protein [Candidatus Heimdallarchaeota archaeon]